ncbi:MAG: tRNA (adenine(22)-N(1))-methyltransferase TrmK, partial [Solobacterium sp.]|nr:tRNA (adenine(22)-N(1))-methyltransferase TrmK [Solobacterium sp.]
MKRMEGLKRMIPKNAVLADIGTDHAYLPILAVSDHTIEKAYACDVAPGPLSQA